MSYKGALANKTMGTWGGVFSKWCFFRLLIGFIGNTPLRGSLVQAIRHRFVSSTCGHISHAVILREHLEFTLLSRALSESRKNLKKLIIGIWLVLIKTRKEIIKFKSFSALPKHLLTCYVYGMLCEPHTNAILSRFLFFITIAMHEIRIVAFFTIIFEDMMHQNS